MMTLRGLARTALSAALTMVSAATAVARGDPSPRVAAVPFVGCRCTGQVERAAPRGRSAPLHVPLAAARQLALYQGDGTPPLLAPRGWHCLGITGSSGTTLLVAPEPLRTPEIFTSGIPSLGVALSKLDSEASGRFLVGELIVRLFPTYRRIAETIAGEFGNPQSLVSAPPYARDRLRYLNGRVVEYTTPAGEEGTGTYRWMRKSGQPVSGIVLLTTPEREPGILLLAMRLPSRFSPATTGWILSALRAYADGIEAADKSGRRKK